MNAFAVKMYDSIRKGEFKENDLMPDVKELCERYQGDEAQIKAGIGDLVYEGALERVPGNPERTRVRKAYVTIGLLSTTRYPMDRA